MTEDPGPYVSLATLCEDVKIDPDGQVSIMRTLQSVTLKQADGGGLPAFEPFEFQCRAVVALSSGAAEGERFYHVRLTMVDPLGRESVVWRDELRFGGDQLGRLTVTQLRLYLPAVGLYWFDVYVGERLMTRFPLEVEYKRLGPN